MEPVAYDRLRSASDNVIDIGCKSFPPNGPIPRQFSSYGQSLTPEITWSHVPTDAKSLLLLVEDPDAPGASQPFVHWLVTNIEPTAKEVPGSGLQGDNSTGSTGYYGPKPPDASPHRYYFELFALDEMLPSSVKDRDSAVAAMQGHVVAKGEFVGTFQKP